MSSPLPRVAIVGRPNVGKSTLFNRMTGTRRAIVDAVAGSTRDRNVGTVTWQERRFELVDTGGLFDRPATPIDEQVAAQVALALAEADVVCWVVDVQQGLVPEDLALVERFRRLGDRLVLAVNKVDHPGRSPAAAEFHRLGIGPLVEISAEHGLGIDELLDAVVARLPAAGPEETPEDGESEAKLRIALVGRPNVGKSSLLNRIAGEPRVVVSEQAGTTRDAIDTLVTIEGRRYRFVDTAGIRRRGKTPARADRLGVLSAERAIERAHVCLLLLDATEPIAREDAAIGGRIEAAGRGCVLVFNKWDLVADRETEAKRRTAEARGRLRYLDFAPIAFVSARTGRGVRQLFPLIERVRTEQRRRIPTPELNRFLEEVARHHPPRARSGKEVRLLYMTQTGVAPPRFVVFGRRVGEVDEGYRRYLAARLRESFGFEGSPVRVRLEGRR